jgi:hypothetical protein
LLLSAALTAFSGCAQRPTSPPVSARGREVCRLESSQALTISDASKRFSLCLRTIDQRLATEAEQERLRTAEAEAAQRNTRLPTAAERYQHCFFHHEEIEQAYRDHFALQGPVSALERDLGPDHPRTLAARQAQQAAYQRLESLLPPEMRGGLPLVPDAAELFQRCNRADFFP